jgi:hypothetical protein
MQPTQWQRSFECAARGSERDGKIRMMLVSSNIDKAFSSVDGTAYTTRILSSISELVPPEHKAEAEKLFLDSIKKA